MSDDDQLIRALEGVVGSRHVLSGAELVAGFVADWTGRWVGHTKAVVRPATVEEVQAVVAICSGHAVPIVPQGGNTGLVGGSIPHGGEVVLSLRRLDRLGPVDVGAREVTAEAGVTIGALQDHARRAGLAYGVDLASRDSATVGGTIATNAGGMNVVAHGDTRSQVLGLQVVFADGRVGNRLAGVVKESTGPDPFRLMVGSEGTLGIITAARLRLVRPATGAPHVTMVPVESLAEGLRHVGPGVHALEFFDHACLELVIEHRHLARPLDVEAPFYVLIESAELPDLEEGAPAVVDRRLWAYRENITETLNQQGVPVKLDVAVPLDQMDTFVVRLRELRVAGQVYVFGHLAEGNFHVNVLESSDPTRVVDQVLGLVAQMGGAIASEHGIGVAKAAWWRRTTDPTVVAVSREIKEALDPGRILNPQVFWGGEPEDAGQGDGGAG
jgi:FAD/FMN-containing dehydrogenase